MIDWAFIAAGLLLAATTPQASAPVAQATVEVVGVTPVDGVGIDADKYPGHVQVLAVRGERSAAGVLAGRAVSVQTNETQGSRWQPDIQFRGFEASPLLGTPEGVAVFQDGVRLNEPFGDTVNLDAVPESAITSIQIMPGSNAAFGLNALGGVIALRTKSGFTAPGVSAEVATGSFGFNRADAAVGWHRNRLGYFLTASHQEETGWRDFSPSRLDHLFGSGQWSRDHGSSDLRLTFADTALSGNGAAPVQLLDVARSAVFTHPDQTQNRVLLLSTAHDAVLRPGLLEVNAFVRRTSTRTSNGDESPYERCAGDPFLLCKDDSDEVIVDQYGAPARATSGHALDAVLNRSRTIQSSIGAAAQLTRNTTLFGDEHRMTIGASFDRGDARFSLHAELADLTETRGTDGTGRIASDSVVGLDTRTSTSSAFVTDVITFTPNLTITVAARFNVSDMRLRDRIGDELSGDHRFQSVNPSAGATYASRVATIFASINQASRTPTPVELTCANPDDPCRLPNAFVSDPPLAQVVARTAEIGVRSRDRHLRWSVAAFRTTNSNDIIFISSGQRGQGYFRNVGVTRRDGIEASLDGRLGTRIEWFANYCLLDATFQNDFTVAAPHHPNANDGEIQVTRGDRLPLLARHAVKSGIAVQAAERIRLLASARYVSRSFFRGDEANAARPLSSYGVADVAAAFTLARHLELELSIRNVANRKYATFGTFGDATRVLGPEYDDPRFVSPAQQRSVQVALTFRR
jgi:iron complex outermembrane receptor protein